MPKAPIGVRVEMTIHEGQQQALERTVADLVEQVEATEPGTLTYEFFLSPDRKHLTVLDWYEDERAAIAHLTGKPVATFLPKLLEHGEIDALDVYGAPGPELSDVLENFPVTGTHRPVSGFMR